MGGAGVMALPVFGVFRSLGYTLARVLGDDSEYL